MNGFVRMGMPAFAMAFASLMLQGQVSTPEERAALAPQVRTLTLAPAVDDFREAVNDPATIIQLGLAGPLTSDQIDQILPIVNEGFASDLPINGSIESLVLQLHSESYRTRERASHDLMCLPPNRLQDITAALAVETDPEAISRMQVVAGHLFLKPRTNVHADAGFLGVGSVTGYVSMLGMKFDDPQIVDFGEAQGMVGVRVRELQPGFPAAQALRNGDVITAIGVRGFPEEMVPTLSDTDGLPEDAVFAASSTNDSRRLAASSMFQARIRALLPGSIVGFTICRDGKLMDVAVQMTAMKAMDGMSLTSLVDVRNRFMADFVASLKTGIQPAVQARVTDAEKTLLTARNVQPIQTQWGLAVPEPLPQRQ